MAMYQLARGDVMNRVNGWQCYMLTVQVADLQVGTSVDLLGVVLSITQTEPKPPEEAVMWRVRIAGPSSDGQGYFAIPVFLW